MKIRRLGEVLINQINAGEVIERPSNVVKELIENSLDAGSTDIKISLKEGGLEEIQVKDNGSGISAEELSLAIERHATSKIKDLKDLKCISSYGFRGEALAAIASISEMVVSSSVDSKKGGAEIRSDFGKVSEPIPVAHSKGTSISVRNIFGKVPARKKFLRRAQTELAHIVKVVREAALSCPEASFQLYHNGELLHSYPAHDLASRYWSCFKPQWESIEISEKLTDLEVSGFLSPYESSQQRSDFVLFINQRPVRNRTLIAAVRNAYLEEFGKGYEPTGVLYLKLNYESVDVNAHPQKLEVRLLFQEKIYSVLFQTVRKALASSHSKALRALKTSAELGKCLGRLGGQYNVYMDREGISILDGRGETFRLELPEIEKHFTQHD